MSHCNLNFLSDAYPSCENLFTNQYIDYSMIPPSLNELRNIKRDRSMHTWNIPMVTSQYTTPDSYFVPKNHYTANTTPRTAVAYNLTLYLDCACTLGNETQ